MLGGADCANFEPDILSQHAADHPKCQCFSAGGTRRNVTRNGNAATSSSLCMSPAEHPSRASSPTAVTAMPTSMPLSTAAGEASRTRKMPRAMSNAADTGSGRSSKETTNSGSKTPKERLFKPAFLAAPMRRTSSSVPSVSGSPATSSTRAPGCIPSSAAWDASPTRSATHSLSKNTPKGLDKSRLNLHKLRRDAEPSGVACGTLSSIVTTCGGSRMDNMILCFPASFIALKRRTSSAVLRGSRTDPSIASTHAPGGTPKLSA
mmetsp:Transcript_124918/g.358679  ORF Transcript_124918/g.358679 Transcript_124918/m.358679 type:complete len:263 (+) Transcript_124918:425-1213(+)